MHVGEISFCDRIAYNIKSEDTKRYVLDKLDRHYNLKIIHKHYDKYMDANLPTLQTNPHMVCLRSNGNPYFLYLMKYNFIQYCVFIDKKIQQGYYLPRMIITHVMFNSSLFEDTVFDGEMVKTSDGSWHFIINDMIVCEGKLLNNTNLPRRINMLYEILASSYKYDTYDLFRISVKTYFKYNELRLIMEHIPKLPYTCRGLYFKPLFLRFKNILYNFDENLIKKVERVKYKNVKSFILLNDKLDDNHANAIQPPNKEFEATKQEYVPSSTINNKSMTPPIAVPGHHQYNVFMVRKTHTPDVYEIYDKEKKQIGIACIPCLKLSKMMRELTKDMNMIDMTSVKFEFSTKFNKWMPLLSQ